MYNLKGCHFTVGFHEFQTCVYLFFESGVIPAYTYAKSLVKHFRYAEPSWVVKLPLTFDKC